MSEWENRNYCIQIVRDHIQETLSSKVLGFCDLMEIDPQIWFEDESGRRNWVIVRHYPSISGSEKNEWIGFEKTNPQLSEYDGHLAALSLVSGEAVTYDAQGNIIPPSKRFTGETQSPLYRGDRTYIKFDGLQRIFLA